ncbi:MAG TPA: outer membrane beta-barrel protein [Candidatus Polarisedimenticolia bacterium]|nr:outer membrane beta-barrel protein [Candidatus Polarisedimenticolia bacterium]
MKASSCIAPLFLLPFIGGVASPPILAANQPGDFSLTTSVGYSSARSDSHYDTDQTISLAVDYQKSRFAGYRASVGFFTLQGRNPVSASAGKQDVDGLFMLGNLVLTPSFATVHPFVTFGVGLYSMRLTDNSGSNQSYELGANWGFGLDVQVVRHFSVHGEAMFHYTTGEVSNPIQTLVVGGRFDF